MVASHSPLPQTNNSPAAFIERLVSEALAPNPTRDERSPEFVAGARTVLLQLLVGKPLACPYPVATAAADAFFAGVEAGRAIHANSQGQLLEYSGFDPYAGLKGHAYIEARNLAQPVRRIVQTSAHTSLDALKEVCK